MGQVLAIGYIFDSLKIVDFSLSSWVSVVTYIFFSFFLRNKAILSKFENLLAKAVFLFYSHILCTCYYGSNFSLISSICVLIYFFPDTPSWNFVYFIYIGMGAFGLFISF